MPLVGKGFGKPLAVGLGEVRQTLTALPLAHASSAPLTPASNIAATGPSLWHLSSELQSFRQAPVRLQCDAARMYPALFGWLDSFATRPPSTSPVESACEAVAATQVADPGALRDSCGEAGVAAEVRSEAGEPCRSQTEAGGFVDQTSEKASAANLCSSAEQKEDGLQQQRQQCQQSLAPEPRSTLAVYESHTRRLEARCQELFGDNIMLRGVVSATSAANDNTRELNERLGREVQQLRRQAADAEGRSAALAAELSQVKAELKSARRRAKTSSRTLDTDGASEALRPASLEPAVSSTGDSEPVFDGAEDLSSPPGLLASGLLAPGLCPPPPGLGLGPLSADLACNFSEWQGWGCEEDSVYSAPLLLAHRDISMKVARGPPGLELERRANETVSLPYTATIVASQMSRGQQLRCN